MRTMKARPEGFGAGKLFRLRFWEAGAMVMAIGMFLAGCAAVPQPGTVQIGVIDPQKVLDDTTAGKEAKASLNTFMKNRQALIELEEKELKRMEEDLIKQASVLSANAKKERETQFRRRMMEYQQKVNELNREVAEKQKEVLQGFREKVQRVAARVAQEKGLKVVFEKGPGSPTLYHEASLDLTEAVIAELNRLPK